MPRLGAIQVRLTLPESGLLQTQGTPSDKSLPGTALLIRLCHRILQQVDCSAGLPGGCPINDPTRFLLLSLAHGRYDQQPDLDRQRICRISLHLAHVPLHSLRP